MTHVSHRFVCCCSSDMAIAVDLPASDPMRCVGTWIVRCAIQTRELDLE